MTYAICKKASLVFFATQFLVLSFSCKTPEQYVVNSWKVEKFQPGTDFSGSPKHMEVFKDFEQHAKFDINGDGTYSFDFGGNMQKGKWAFDRKKMILTTTDENGVATISKVIELQPGKLVLEQEDKGVRNVITLVPKGQSR